MNQDNLFFCSKCKGFVYLIKPIYTSLNSNKYFCSKCGIAVYIKKQINRAERRIK